MASIYDLAEDFRELLEQCDGSDNDVTETLAALEMDIEQKIINGISLIKNLKSQSEAINNEIKNLTNRRNSTDKRIQQIKQYFMDYLRYTGKTKFWTPRGTMSIAKNGGKRTLKIDDANLVPAEFKTTVYNEVMDLDMIRLKLESGEIVPGAYLEERGEYLKVS